MWGQDTGRCETNPIRDIRNSAKYEPRETSATDTEIKKLWAACEDEAAASLLFDMPSPRSDDEKVQRREPAHFARDGR